MTNDTDRLNKIGSAVIRGVPKDEFPFEDDDERVTWDQISREVAAIRSQGGTPVLPGD